MNNIDKVGQNEDVAAEIEKKEELHFENQDFF